MAYLIKYPNYSEDVIFADEADEDCIVGFKYMAPKEERERPEVADGTNAPREHLDLSLIIPKLKHMHKLSIMFKMVDMGLDYDPKSFKFTWMDCENMAKGE